MKTSFEIGAIDILLVVVILLPTITTTIEKGVTAEDYNRHGPWAAAWLSGAPVPLSVYPPLFHIFLVPFLLLLGNSIAYLQIALIAGVSATLLYLADKNHGRIAAYLTAGGMVSANIYNLYYSSLTPQTLDMILFPFALLFLSQGKYLKTSLLLIALFYNHSIGAIYFGIVLIIALLTNRKYLRWLPLVILAAAPVLTSYYLPQLLGANDTFSGASLPNEIEVKNQMWATYETVFYMFPIEHFIIFNGLIVVLLPVTVWSLWKRRNLDRWQFYYAIWFFAFVPLCFFNLFRAWTFMLVPLLMFEASAVAKAINKSKENKPLCAS